METILMKRVTKRIYEILTKENEFNEAVPEDKE
jgi:hypothetical protein